MEFGSLSMAAMLRGRGTRRHDGAHAPWVSWGPSNGIPDWELSLGASLSRLGERAERSGGMVGHFSPGGQQSQLNHPEGGQQGQFNHHLVIEMVIENATLYGD